MGFKFQGMCGRCSRIHGDGELHCTLQHSQTPLVRGSLFSQSAVNANVVIERLCFLELLHQPFVSFALNEHSLNNRLNKKDLAICQAPSQSLSPSSLPQPGHGPTPKTRRRNHPQGPDEKAVHRTAGKGSRILTHSYLMVS